jgi:hypothetical protein
MGRNAQAVEVVQLGKRGGDAKIPAGATHILLALNLGNCSGEMDKVRVCGDSQFLRQTSHVDLKCFMVLANAALVFRSKLSRGVDQVYCSATGPI